MPAREYAAGSEVAGFTVVRELGRGSHAVVYQVHRDGEPYALKLLLPTLDAGDLTVSFRREAALLGCANHPGLAKVHEVGTVDGQPYLVLEYIEGRPLTSVLARGPLALGRLISVGSDVAGALSAAHAAGMIHRDVKPDNIVIGPNGHASVVDFGLAAAVDSAGDAAVAGTMRYCAPEQSGMLNRPVDSRADLYALGVVLFECATGRPPFAAPDVGEMLRLHASAAPPDLRELRPDLPATLAEIIHKLLAKDPDDRYQSGAGVARDLQRLAADPVTPFEIAAADEPVAAARDFRLIGREHEIALLTDRWERARRGAGGVAVIAGPPGSGKSRLARELTALAERAGAAVLFGKCDPDEAVPLAPVRQAIEDYLQRLRRLPPQRREAEIERVTAAAESAAALLRGLSPTLAELLGRAPPPEQDGHEQFAAAVAELLATLARSCGGAVLHLDDVQWLDATTQKVLRLLEAELPRAPLLVLATIRKDPGTGAVPPAPGAVDLVVRLGPLTTPAVRELVAAAAGGLTVDEATADGLAAHSDGNPFTLLEYLTALIRSGLAVPSWGGLRIDLDQLSQVELPTNAIDLVLTRLHGLDDRSRHLLGVAAAVGARFDPDFLAEVCETDRKEVVAVAGTASWRHLVERLDSGRYAFVHDSIREALLAQLDPTERRGVHDRIAEVLERRGGRDRDAVYALAVHSQLGDTDRYARRLFRAAAAAGRLALVDQAPTTALSFLEIAAAAADRAGIMPSPQFRLYLGVALHRTGRFSDAIDTLTNALSEATDRRQRARIRHAIARVHDNTWNTAGQATAIEAALRELGRPLPRSRWLLVGTSLMRFLASVMVEVTRIGYGTARGDRRDLHRLLAMIYDAGALAYARDLRPGVAALLQLRAVYPVTRLGPGPEAARMHIGSAHLALAAGLPRVARFSAARARRVAARVGDPRVTAYVAWLAAVDRHGFGQDQGESVRWVLSTHGRWLEVGHYLDLLHILCWDALLRGDLELADDVFARRRAVVAASDQTARNIRHASEAGQLALRGRGREAAEYLRQMRAEMGSEPLRWERVDLLHGTIMTAVEDHDLDTFDAAARELARLNLQLRMLLPPQLSIYVSIAYGRLQQYREAEPRDRPRRFDAARTAVERLRRAANTPLIRAHYRVVHAALRQVAGAPEAALLELDQAGPVMRAVDAPLIAYEAARVRALCLRGLGTRGEAERQATHAEAIAVRNGWPHRARRLAAEFGLVPGPGTVSPTRIERGDGIALGRYRQRLDAMEQVGLAASRVIDPTRLAAIALDETIHILGAERAFLFLADGDPPRLVPHGGRDAEGNDLSDLTGYSASLVERVRQTQEALVITGTDQAAALGARSVVLHGLRSIMVAPLQLEGRLLGVVYLDSRVAKGIFTEEDVGILVAITNHIAVALETARAAQLEVAITAAERRRDLAETLREALVDISGTLEPDQVLRRLLLIVARVVPSDVACLVLGRSEEVAARLFTADPDDGDAGLRDAARGGSGTAETGAGGYQMSTVEVDATLGRLLDADSPVVQPADNERPAVLADLPAPGGSWMTVPLRTRDQRLGVLLVGAARRDAYDRGQAEIAAALVGQGMIAYENARLFAQVQQLATIDELTGVANRRHFFELAGREMALARRHKRRFAAMMIDIDNFKMINDRYGHQVGDEVIRIVTARLSHFAREYDLVGRYGGEEFAIVMPTGDENAGGVAERLRRAIADAPVATSAGPITVTISIGVTYLRRTDADISSLLARADRLLLDAKQNGRNRVCSDLIGPR